MEVLIYIGHFLFKSKYKIKEKRRRKSVEKELYWKIDPEKLIDKNVHFNDIELNVRNRKYYSFN